LPEEFFYGYTPIAAGYQDYLDRPRINSLLEKAVLCPIVSVVAGAGYGKTWALYSFVREYNVRTAWIQCSEQDNMEERFWENFISAISIISSETAQKLRQMNFPATDRQFERYLTIPRKNAIPNKKYIIVYDDLHLITEKTVLHFIEQSVIRSFLNITFVMISRTEPQLDFTKIEEKKLLARITEDDLRFSRNEMDSYFRLQQLSPAPQTASAIYHDTEGWAFAVHLAALALRNHPAGQAYAAWALRSNVFKLIESEIMAPLSPEMRRFLIKLSLVDDPNPELVREIGQDAAIINEIAKIGSFIHFDSYLNSYRIHKLFMDYLREQQDELSDEEKKEVWTKTAAWCAANNRKMDAILNYEKTGDYDGIVNTLYTLPQIFPQRMAAFVLDIMDRAPETIFRDFPKTLIMRYRTLTSLGRFDQCRDEILEKLPSIRALGESPEKHYILMVCYMILGFIGFIRSIHTRRYDFIDYFREAAVEGRLSEHVTPPPVNGMTLSAYACRVMAPASGKEIEEFIEVIGETVPYSAEAMGGCQYGMYELARGELAFFRSELDESEKQLLESLAKAREKQQYEIENRALFYLLRIYLSRGNAKGTESVLTQLEAELEETFFPNRHSYYDIVTGWYYIQTGRKEKIAPWIKSDYKESDLNSGAQGLEKLVKAKYYISEKRYPAALAVMESRGNTESLLMGNIETKVLEAICHYRLSDRERAFTALTEACTLAAPAGLFMPFTEQGKDMRALAEALVRETAAGDKVPEVSPERLEEIRRNAAIYAKKLYRQTEQAMSGKGHKEGGLLSHREREVLVGLSQGLTREEIANAASISPNTVKSVTRSIYNKLGALNQADAVRIAAEKNILS